MPPRENSFQYVGRVYANTINIPCSSTLIYINLLSIYIPHKGTANDVQDIIVSGMTSV